VWAGPLADGARVALLLNRGDVPATITASWDVLGLAPTGDHQVMGAPCRHSACLANGYPVSGALSYADCVGWAIHGRNPHSVLWSDKEDVPCL
jgi:hypothetical protein